MCGLSVFVMCIPDAYRGQKKALDLLELELQTQGASVWVLGIKLGSSARAASALN